jgi:hypothetical protein
MVALFVCAAMTSTPVVMNHRVAAQIVMSRYGCETWPIATGQNSSWRLCKESSPRAEARLRRDGVQNTTVTPAEAGVQTLDAPG